MSCRLLVSCDEMRKRHVVDKIKAKTSKTMKKANRDENVGANVTIQNNEHAF